MYSSSFPPPPLFNPYSRCPYPHPINPPLNPYLCSPYSLSSSNYPPPLPSIITFPDLHPILLAPPPLHPYLPFLIFLQFSPPFIHIHLSLSPSNYCPLFHLYSIFTFSYLYPIQGGGPFHPYSPFLIFIQLSPPHSSLLPFLVWQNPSFSYVCVLASVFVRFVLLLYISYWAEVRTPGVIKPWEHYPSLSFPSILFILISTLCLSPTCPACIFIFCLLPSALYITHTAYDMICKI